VLVYEGGELWGECWQSVRGIQNDFDEVIIGINQSAAQYEDLKTCKQDLNKNAKIYLQPHNISYVEHLTWLISKVKSDYIFFLCHDDLIIREGIKDVRTLINKSLYNHIGIFGSQIWVYPNNEELKLELDPYLGVMPRDKFIIADAAKHFSFNLSGIVGHTDSIKKNLVQSEIFSKYGFRFDNWILTQPNIKSIYQINNPIVKIRVHNGQLGQSTVLKERAFDNISYYFIIALYAKSSILCRVGVQKIFSNLMGEYLLRNIGHLFTVFCCSLRWCGDKRYANLFIQTMQYIIVQAPSKLISKLRVKSEVD